MTSIRFQLVVATAIVSLVLALLFLPLAQRQFEGSFHAFEAGYAEQELQRLDLLLAERGAALGRTALDYSRWDDTVEYLTGRRPQWLEENLTADVFANFGVSIIVVADRRLHLVAVRTAGRQPRAPPAEALLRTGGTCAAAMKRRTPLHRFEMHNGVAFVVACSPVTGTQAASPVVGVMVWAVEMTPARIADVARLSQFPFDLSAAVPGQYTRAVRFEDDRIAARLPLRDWRGDVAVIASMQLPRPLGAQRQVATRTMLVLLAAALFSPPLLMLILLETYVVRRIRHVSQWVRAMSVGEAGRLDRRRLLAPGKQAGFAELAMLTHDFVELTDRLEASRAGWQAEALRDSLTGLGSRARLLGDLTPLLASADGTAVALLLIDLDGFKAVNDMLGHPTGDALLQEVADSLRQLVPAAAGTYRLGGDEFAVVWAGYTAHAPETLARTISESLRVVRQAAGKPLAVTACVGVGLIDILPHALAPRLGVSELLTQADVALYEAKRSGRGAYRMFSASTHATYREHVELESGLRAALAEGRLEAWFQPIVDARSGAVVAVEALARWHEPVRGWVPPCRFIAVAERSGQVIDVDIAVIGCALRAFAGMRALLPSLRLHVNTSAQSLADPQFRHRLASLFDSGQVPQTAVAVELTESDLSVGHEDLELALTALRATGLDLVVDDFGVGASSLGRLARVRPSAVKIDGSFVLDIHGDGGRICRAIIELARELGMTSVAEYVESPEHAQLLAAMGCDALQGYAISAPKPASDLLAWLRALEAGRWSAPEQ